MAQLAAFALLGAFAGAHWFRLVEGAAAARLIGAVVVAAALGAALHLLERSGLPRAAVHAGALAATVTAGLAGLVVTGLPARLLGPRAWDDLASRLDRGMGGIPTVQWPYSGPDEWVSLVILLGAPVLLTLGAALAFWPARRGARALRAGGLVALMCLYAIPVTEYDPGAPLLRGFALLMLMAAWLWLPRLRGRGVAVALAVVGVVGVGALPVAAKLDSDAALVDYRSWQWFGDRGITFNWNHSYGPLDWPRKGTTLLNVESDKPLYWKVETLDSFDGLRWLRTDANRNTPVTAELPARIDPRWEEKITVTVRSLRTSFLVGTGTPFDVTGGVDGVTGSGDGTLRLLGEPLERGDSYTVRAYSPDPGEERMRAASAPYSPDLRQYTRIELPAPGETALPDDGPIDPAQRTAVEVPLRGGEPTGADAARRALSDSPYSETYALARRLTAGAPTAFDAVDRVRDHLLTNYTYSERPPSHEFPLESFLFEDEIGYCQQFSGAMALMLRMTGIPTRVVSGFSPGSFNSDDGEFRVRDLDAHSWVEVYFPDIGWVTFDPTPRAAPADRAGRGPESEPLDFPAGGSTDSSEGAAVLSDRGSDPAPDAASGGGGGGSAIGPLALLGALSLAAAVALAARRVIGARRRFAPAATSLRELERALPRLGWSLRPGTTLLELERRLARAAGPESAGYVRRLRELRFGADGGAPPAPGQRRAARRELTAAGGLRARLRGFRALPPGGPRV